MDNTEAQLKGRLWLAVEEILRNKREDVIHTDRFVNALVELIYLQLLDMGRDLEQFAGHAGRNVVSNADLELLLRKTSIEVKKYVMKPDNGQTG